MLIDVYDFDGTIYDGDSTVDLVLFCLRRHPALLTGLPGMLPRLVGALTGGLTATAAGITAAICFGWLVSLCFKGKPKG